MPGYMPFSYYLPILIVVGSNVIYHIGAKAVPRELNPMVCIVIGYIVGAVFSLAVYLLTDPTKDIIGQVKLVNWAPIAIGLSIVGLELGSILLYRVGWDISIGSLVSNILLAIVLIIVGLLFYKESINLHQFFGIALCMIGLVFINK